MVLVDGWAKNLMSHDLQVASAYLKSKVVNAISNLRAVVNEATEKDILIVKRGSMHEAWTLREFKAGELVLVPESTEIKQRFYTQERSAICKNTVDPTSKDKRPLVIDGPMRAAPSLSCCF